MKKTLIALVAAAGFGLCGPTSTADAQVTIRTGGYYNPTPNYVRQASYFPSVITNSAPMYSSYRPSYSNFNSSYSNFNSSYSNYRSGYGVINNGYTSGYNPGYNSFNNNNYNYNRGYAQPANYYGNSNFGVIVPGNNYGRGRRR